MKKVCILAIAAMLIVGSVMAQTPDPDPVTTPLTVEEQVAAANKLAEDAALLAIDSIAYTDTQITKKTVELNGIAHTKLKNDIKQLKKDIKALQDEPSFLKFFPTILVEEPEKTRVNGDTTCIYTITRPENFEEKLARVAKIMQKFQVLATLVDDEGEIDLGIEIPDAVDLSGYVQRSELPKDKFGKIDVASKANVASAKAGAIAATEQAVVDAKAALEEALGGKAVEGAIAEVQASVNTLRSDMAADMSNLDSVVLAVASGKEKDARALIYAIAGDDEAFMDLFPSFFSKRDITKKTAEAKARAMKLELLEPDPDPQADPPTSD